MPAPKTYYAIKEQIVFRFTTVQERRQWLKRSLKAYPISSHDNDVRRALYNGTVLTPDKSGDSTTSPAIRA